MVNVEMVQWLCVCCCGVVDANEPGPKSKQAKTELNVTAFARRPFHLMVRICA
jgi:hypothetical protein